MEIITQKELERKARAKKYKQVKARIISNIEKNIKEIVPEYADDKLDTKAFKASKNAKLRCFYPDKDANETIYKLRNSTSVVLLLKETGTEPADITKTLNTIKGKVEKDEKDIENAIYEYIDYRATKQEEVQRQKAEVA